MASAAWAVRARIAVGPQFDILYRDALGARTRRRVLCSELQQRGGQWYVEAYCFKRREMRHFRLDRLLEAVDPGTGEVLSPDAFLFRLLPPEAAKAPAASAPTVSAPASDIPDHAVGHPPGIGMAGAIAALAPQPRPRRPLRERLWRVALATVSGALAMLVLLIVIGLAGGKKPEPASSAAPAPAVAAAQPPATADASSSPSGRAAAPEPVAGAPGSPESPATTAAVPPAKPPAPDQAGTSAALLPANPTEADLAAALLAGGQGGARGALCAQLVGALWGRRLVDLPKMDVYPADTLPIDDAFWAGTDFETRSCIAQGASRLLAVKRGNTCGDGHQHCGDNDLVVVSRRTHHVLGRWRNLTFTVE